MRDFADVSPRRFDDRMIVTVDAPASADSLDAALRRFKKSTERAGLPWEFKKRKAYEKPSARRKRKSTRARMRARRRERKQKGKNNAADGDG